MRNFGSVGLAIGLAVLCCALPLLLVSGVSIGAGVLFGKIALVTAGLAGIGFAVYRATRRRHRTVEPTAGRMP